MPRPLWCLIASVIALVGASARAQQADAVSASVLGRVAEYVEEYYSRAQSIVALETVTVQNVTRDLAGDGFPRRFVYNLRVEWTPSASGTPEASLTRELISVNGRAPRPGDEPHCTAPRPISPEPLAMFLRERQSDFLFSRQETVRLDGRDAVRVDYRLREPEDDRIEWDRECVSMNFPARLRGRVWLDGQSGAVLRIDEGANGPVEVRAPRQQQRAGLAPSLLFERWNVSIRYRAVTFSDPDETIMLPASIDAISMARSNGTRRTQTYSNYRRFVTGGRIVP